MNPEGQGVEGSSPSGGAILIGRKCNLCQKALFLQGFFGFLRLSVSVEYFYDAGDKDVIIADEVSKHPELMDMMESSHDEEKEVVMNDPKLRAIIEQLAEGTGLSPEEYYDHFDAMLKEHPEIFEELLDKGLRDKRERFDNE